MSHEAAHKQTLFPFLFLKTSKTPTRVLLPATHAVLGPAEHRTASGARCSRARRSPLLPQVPELGDRCKSR